MLETITRQYMRTDDNVWVSNTSGRDFDYSDGEEAETRLLNIVMASSDKTIFSEQIAANISDWPSLYHLSSRRANLLRPILDSIQGDVLEIGAGCGALTRFLGEEQRSVLALEGSPRRAKIAAQRCLDLRSVHVLVENFDQFALDFQFDVVLAIGVLEYSRKFFHTAPGVDPCDAFLAYAAKFLKPNGKLVVAIENQLGLKYFAGYREDHVGESFFGIEDLYQPDGVVTFGRTELKSRLIRAGFSALQWWYPYPDYKLPASVISEQAIRDGRFDAGTLCARSVLSDPQRPDFALFSLERAWRLLQRNGLLEDLANSFLVIASRESIPMGATFAYHYGDFRRREFTKVVQYISTNHGIHAVRSPLLKRTGSGQIRGIRQHLQDEDYIVGELWQDRLVEILNRPSWSLDDVTRWAMIWCDALIAHAGLSKETGETSVHSLMAGKYVDCIPRNMLVNGGRCHFFDQEWETATRVELGFLLFRGLFDAFGAISACNRPQPGVSFVKDQLIVDVAFGLGFWLSRDDVRRYKDFEGQFQERLGAAPPNFGPKPFGNELLPIRRRLDTFEALQASLSASEAKVNELETHLREAVTAARQREQALDANLADRLAELATAQAELSETRERLAVSEARVAELETALQDVVATGRLREQALDAILADRQAELATAQAEHSQTRERLAVREARVAELETALQDVVATSRQREQALDANLADRLAELATAQAEHFETRERLAVSEARIAELETALQDAVATSREREQALDANLADRLAELATEQAEHSGTRERLAVSEARVAELETALQDVIATSRQREQALDANLAERLAELATAQAEHSETRRRLAVREAKVAELETNLRDIVAAGRQREQTLNAIRADRQKDREASLAERKAMEARLTAREARIAELETALQDFAATSRQREQALNATLADRAAELETARTQYADLARRQADQSEKHKQEMGALRSQLVATEAAAARRARTQCAIPALRRWRLSREARMLEQTGLFDASRYATAHADVAKTGMRPAEHYLEEGFALGYKPNPLFDTTWYMDVYEDVRRSGINPLVHYALHGVEEGRDPGPNFQTEYYMANNPDVRASGINPLAHYLRHGRHEGRFPVRPA